MRPSIRCLFLSALSATVLVSAVAFVYWALRDMNWGQWATTFFVSWWFVCVMAFFRGFTKLEVLWFMDRDWQQKRAARR